MSTSCDSLGFPAPAQQETLEELDNKLSLLIDKLGLTVSEKTTDEK